MHPLFFCCYLPSCNIFVNTLLTAKRVVSAIIASDIYRQDGTKKMPSIPEMAKEISERIDKKCADSLLSQISSSITPQVEVEKVYS